jgi:hypothetical protein
MLVHTNATFPIVVVCAIVISAIISMTLLNIVITKITFETTDSICSNNAGNQPLDQQPSCNIYRITHVTAAAAAISTNPQ